MSYRGVATRPLSFWLRDIWDSGRLNPALARAAAGLGALSPLMALANPTGGQVVGGSATINTPNANATVVNQTSQNAAINWQQFSVGANQYVQFNQPNSSSVVLNRVIGSNPSSIFGNITANGQVFLINPNGILFAPGATLDVAGLVASTQDISTSDFMAGRYSLIKASGAPDASVINQGSITTGANGYVVLAGDYVENDGVIQAQSGRVLLAAGGATTLTLDQANGLIAYSIDSATLARLAGVKNAGEISAAGGTVIMSADVANALTATAVNNTGFVSARSIQSRDGVIILAAEGGDIENSGTLDASAAQSGVVGGTVILRGDAATELTPTSVIDTAGDGARGGFVEISGHGLTLRGQTNLGHGGSLLLDPANLKIVTGASVTFSPSDHVGTGYIKGQLSAGNNVYLVASKSIGRAASATGISESSTGQAGKLSIRIGTLTVGAGGSLAGTHCVNAGVCGPGTGVTFTKATGGKINLSGFNISIKGIFYASASQGTVSIGNITAKEIVINGGAPANAIKLGALTATSAFPASSTFAGGLGVYVNAPNANITMTSGAKISASHGGVVLKGGNISLGSVTAGGKLSVSATKTGPASASIVVASGKLLKAQSVRLFASGSDGAQITASGIHATGGSISIDARANASHAAKVSAGSLNAFSRVTVQESGGGNGGFISVGNITAGGSVSVRASDAAGSGDNIAVGSVTGRTIQIAAHAKKGGDINVAGGLTATASRGQVLLSASDTSAAANGGNVNVTGDINALSGHVSIVTHGGGSLGGTLQVGNINARGGVGISANYLGAGSGFVAHAGNITATNGAVGISMTGHAPQFSAGAIAAHGPSSGKPSYAEAGAIPNGFVKVALNKTGSASGGFIKVNGFVVSGQSDVSFFVKNGNIKFAGASNVIHAASKVTLTANSVSDAGALSITAHDAGVATASIAVNAASLKAASVTLLASGSLAGKITTGNITANGAVTGIPSHSVGGSIVAKTAELLPTVTSHRGTVTTGDLSATGRITVFGTNISVGGVNAGGQMFLSADGTSARHATVTASKAIVFGAYGSIDANGPSGSIHVGDVTATNGSVSFFASGNGAHPGGKMTVGNVTSKHYVAFFADSRAGSVNVGTIKASTSYVSVSAAKLTTTGPVTAASYVSFYGGKFTVGGAVTAGAYVEMRGTQINVAGAVTAGSQFGVTLPGHARPVNTGFVKLSANSSAGKGSVNVTGSVQGRTASITAHGGTSADVSVGAITATAGAILVKTTAPRGADIRINGPLSAAGAFSTGSNLGMGIVLNAHATGGSHSPGGNIRLTGSGSQAVHALAGGVSMIAQGGTDSGGKIQVNGGIVAAGNVYISGFNSGSCCGSVSLNNVTGGNSIQLRAGGPGNQLTVGSVHGGSVHVTGAHITMGSVTATEGLSVDAVAGTGSVAKINVASSHALQGRFVQLRATGGSGGSIKVGNVTATGGSIIMTADATGLASKTALISAKNITATHGEVELKAHGSGAQISVGSIDAEYFSGSVYGAGAKFIAKGITATGSSSGCSTCEGGSKGFIKLKEAQPAVDTAASMSIAGPVKSSHGFVSFSGGNGAAVKVIGNVTAQKTVTISGGDITVTGHVKGSDVSMTARTSGSGDIGVTGSITATSNNVNLQATHFGGAGGNISAGNINAGARVTIRTRGAGAAGGDLKTGTITAVNGISINARYSGSQASAFKVQTGAISGAHVLVLMNGHDPKFSAAGITATGPSSARYQAHNFCSGECGPGSAGTHHGFIGVKITPNGSSGSIKVTGPIVSQQGGVVMSASRGALHVTGNMNAFRNVDLTGNSVSVAAISAGSSVSINGAGPGITINGGISAGRIILSTNVTSGGDITVHGGLHANTGNILVNAGGSVGTGGNIQIDNNVRAFAGNVTLQAFGGGASGANITVGNVTASGVVNIHDDYIASAGSLHPQATEVKVTTGVIKAGENILVLMTGPAPHLTAAGMSAAGSSGVVVKLTPTGAAGSSGVIHVTGPIVASSSSVVLNPGFPTASHTAPHGAGSINTVSIDGAFGIHLTGSTIKVGGLSASNGSVSITGVAANGPTGITVTGPITAQSVKIQELLPKGDSHSGTITLQGNVKATGTTSGGAGIDVTASHSGSTTAVNMHIGVASLTAQKGNVRVIQHGQSGGISATGLISAAAGSVSLQANGSAGISVASIKSHFETSLHVTGSHAGAITVNGNISASGEGVFITDTGSGGNNIHVNGNIGVGNTESNEAVNIDASAGTHSGGNVTVGGKITSITGAVSITAHGGGALGGGINVGSISAHNSVTIAANYVGASTGFKVQTGKLTGKLIDVTMTGKAPQLTIGGAKATGPSGSSCECGQGYVRLRLNPNGPSSGSITIGGPVHSQHGSVSVNAVEGAINASSGSVGKLVAGGSISVTGGQIQLGNLSAGRKVVVHAGTGAAHPGDITVNGNVVGAYINMSAIGSGAGNITVNGTINQAKNSHLSTNGVTLDASGGSAAGGNIKVTGAISAEQFVRLSAHGGGASGGNITVGNVTVASSDLTINAAYLGTAAGFTVKTGLLTAGFVQVGLDGHAAVFSGAGIVGNGLSCECSADVGVRINAVDAPASGSIHLTGAVTATRGGVRLDAGHGVINMTGNSISAAGSSGNVRLFGNHIKLGNITATGGLSVSAVGVSGARAAVTAAPTSVWKAGRVNIQLSGSGSGGGNINIGTVQATGGGTHSGTGAIKIGDIGNVTSHNVTVTTGNLTAAKSIAVHITNSSGSMTLGDLKAPIIGVSLGVGNLKVGAISANAGAESISAAGGSLTVTTAGNVNLNGGTLKAGGAIHMQVGGSLGISNVNLTDSAFSASAGNDLSVSVTGNLNLAGQKAVAGKALNLTATGNVFLGGAIIGGSAVNITAVAITNSSAGGSITAGAGALKATGGSIVLKGETLNLTAGTGLLLSAHSNVDLSSVTASGAGKLTVQAGAAVNATSITYSGAGLQITAAGPLTLTNATVNAGGSVNLHANSMALRSADINAAGALNLQVTHALDLAHVTLSGAAINASAGGDITNSGSAVTLTAGAGGLSFKSGGNVILGDEILHVGGATLLSAAGGVDLTNTALTAGGNVTVLGTTLSEDLANIDAGGAITEAGGNVDLTSATLKAGRALDIHANQGIKLANAVLTGSGVSALGAVISNSGSAASITAGAGGLKLKSASSITLGGETLKVGAGDATFSAAGNISLTGAVLTAGSAHMVAAGSVDLSGITLTASKTVQLVADKDIILSGVNITANTFIADASGTIHNGGGPGTLTANGLALVAGKNIDMTSTQISIGNGSVSSVQADALLLTELAGTGIAPTSGVLNGAFIAGGSVALGGLTITGHYLEFQGTSVAILGKVNAPTSGLLVQVVPFDTTASIGVEGGPGSTQAFNLSNTGFFALFPGDTIAIGDDVESGSVFIGLNGPFTLANNTNLFFDTSGPITGLNLITSTGLVTSLETFIAATATNDVVTAGEIDPNAGSGTNTGLGDATDKKHLGQAGSVGGGGQPAGTVSGDNGDSGVCH